MLTSSSDLPVKPIKVKLDNKFSSTRISRETLVPNSSLEVYYGGASVGVPFMWESQPGTPKVRFRENPLPPLTPPPSFHFDPSPSKKPTKRYSKPNLFHTVLPKLNVRKTSHPPSPMSSISSSSRSSSHSVPSSPFTPPNIREQFHLSSPILFPDARIDKGDEYGSPVSTLCFGTGRVTNARSRSRSSNIIKVLLREFR